MAVMRPGKSVGLEAAWPVYSLIDDLRPTLWQWAVRGETAAIATLVTIVGSSPRPLGSEMAIAANGEVAGYVSGGCVEGAVVAQAERVITSGEPMMLDYGAGSPVLDVQLTCGGRIGIFVRAIPKLVTYAERLRDARGARDALDVVINLNSGQYRFETGATEPMSNDDSFRKTYLPTPRLVLIGGDPVTLALCQLAPQFGFEVGLLRPYGPSAPPDAVSIFHYDTRPLARALEDLPVDAWTAIYTLAHNIEDDQAVLLRALRSPAFAVGALGSRRKVEERNQCLRKAGLGDEEIARLNTPAGLDIGAQNPYEIALSMLAELIAKRPRANASAM